MRKILDNIYKYIGALRIFRKKKHDSPKFVKQVTMTPKEQKIYNELMRILK